VWLSLIEFDRQTSQKVSTAAPGAHNFSTAPLFSAALEQVLVAHDAETRPRQLYLDLLDAKEKGAWKKLDSVAGGTILLARV